MSMVEKKGPRDGVGVQATLLRGQNEVLVLLSTIFAEQRSKMWKDK